MVRRVILDGSKCSQEPLILNEDSRSPIRVAYEVDYGPPGIDIRRCFYGDDSGEELILTKKGVRIPEDMYGELLYAIFRLAFGWIDEDIRAIGDLIAVSGWDNLKKDWDTIVGGM